MGEVCRRRSWACYRLSNGAAKDHVRSAARWGLCPTSGMVGLRPRSGNVGRCVRDTLDGVTLGVATDSICLCELSAWITLGTS